MHVNVMWNYSGRTTGTYVTSLSASQAHFQFTKHCFIRFIAILDYDSRLVGPSSTDFKRCITIIRPKMYVFQEKLGMVGRIKLFLFFDI